MKIVFCPLQFSARYFSLELESAFSGWKVRILSELFNSSNQITEPVYGKRKFDFECPIVDLCSFYPRTSKNLIY